MLKAMKRIYEVVSNIIATFVRRFDYFKDSNRDLHFSQGLIVSFLLTILFCAGIATGMEKKDELKGGKFDWEDWKATMYGGIIGQIFQILVILLFFLII